MRSTSNCPPKEKKRRRCGITVLLLCVSLRIASFSKGGKDTRRLEIGVWLVAWDRYTLAAQAVDHQLTYQQALAHKEVVLEIAFSAKAAGRSELLGVLYDELARSPRVCLCGRIRNFVGLF